MSSESIFSLSSQEDTFELGPLSIKTVDIEMIINKAIIFIIILIAIYFTIKIGDKIIDVFVKRQIKSNKKFSMDQQKARTIGGILKSVLKYMTYFVGIGFIIGNIFSTVSIAVAGFGTVALGLGAQSLIKDIINGFFILFEDQYGVGDHVTIGSFDGIVETIGIRTTVIRDFSGDMHLIANGAIVEVTNHSRGNIRFMIDVYISYDEDTDKVINIIDSVCTEFEKKNKDVTEPICVLGITSLNEFSVTIRVVGKSKPLSQWDMERGLRRDIKLSLDKNGIQMPKTESLKRG